MACRKHRPITTLNPRICESKKTFPDESAESIAPSSASIRVSLSHPEQHPAILLLQGHARIMPQPTPLSQRLFLCLCN
eukprot:CAMPEP_0177697402 /NCGR_PEP_ID=MMETSP0484_2-20121128/4495_1 /TAXON_ID=354590 /ORGANISM="Rhodomonas lens, Strain RHODO" /LENGTH=77 /DNA_ID=CAMNT_0019208439 /DNA_START=149 /DNA_END=379 /DNA_ORIENTATION=+